MRNRADAPTADRRSVQREPQAGDVPLHVDCKYCTEAKYYTCLLGRCIRDWFIWRELCLDGCRPRAVRHGLDTTLRLRPTAGRPAPGAPAPPLTPLG